VAKDWKMQQQIMIPNAVSLLLDQTYSDCSVVSNEWIRFYLTLLVIYSSPSSSPVLTRASIPLLTLYRSLTTSTDSCLSLCSSGV